MRVEGRLDVSAAASSIVGDGVLNISSRLFYDFRDGGSFSFFVVTAVVAVEILIKQACVLLFSYNRSG